MGLLGPDGLDHVLHFALREPCATRGEVSDGDVLLCEPWADKACAVALAWVGLSIEQADAQVEFIGIEDALETLLCPLPIVAFAVINAAATLNVYADVIRAIAKALMHIDVPNLALSQIVVQWFGPQILATKVIGWAAQVDDVLDAQTLTSPGDMFQQHISRTEGVDRRCCGLCGG